MSLIWTPHLTVAAIAEQNGRFLLVEEAPQGRRVLNQPAGHVEENETIPQALVREMREETCLPFSPEEIVGIYRWRSPHNNVTYLRVAITGSCGPALPDCRLDPDILATHWLGVDTLRADPSRLRSPMVMRCFEDYLAGHRYPLSLLSELA